MTRASTLRSRMLGNSHVRFWRRAGAGNRSCLASGYSVVGTKDTVVNLMVEAPAHVKEAVEVRRTMRRARRHRKWRRPKRFDNRLKREKRLPPSTRSRWEAKARIIRHLGSILPLTDVVMEDVQALTRKGRGGRWNTSFRVRSTCMLSLERWGSPFTYARAGRPKSCVNTSDGKQDEEQVKTSV